MIAGSQYTADEHDDVVLGCICVLDIEQHSLAAFFAQLLAKPLQA